MIKSKPHYKKVLVSMWKYGDVFFLNLESITSLALLLRKKTSEKNVYVNIMALDSL